MSHCTREHLESRIGAERVAMLADHDQDGAEDMGVVEQAIADADALLDAAIAVRWPQCVGQTSRVLTLLAVDLAIDRLAVGTQRTEDIQDIAKLAESRLAEIRAGRTRPCETEAETVSATGKAVARAARPRMTRRALGDLL